MSGPKQPTQRAVLLEEAMDPPVFGLELPQPPDSVVDLKLEAYLPFLPGADPASLRHTLLPFSTLTERPALLIYDARPAGEGEGEGGQPREANPIAARLTAGLKAGPAEALDIAGGALLLYADPGRDFTVDDWAEHESCISGPFAELFAGGSTPAQEQLGALLARFKAGEFRTTLNGMDLGGMEQERYDMAELALEWGNRAFKEKQYGEAVKQYGLGVKVCKAQEEKGRWGVPIEKWTALEVALQTNRAVALLNAGEAEGGSAEDAAAARQQAEEACTAALQLEPGNTKALFRRARARFELGRLQEGDADIQQLVRAGSNDLMVETLRRQIEEGLQLEK